MRRKLLLLTILLLPFLPVRIQAEGSDRDDIHIRITEAGIQKTSADDIVLSRMLPGDEQTYTLRVDNRSKEEQELYLKLSTGEGQLAEILELQVTQDVHRLYENYAGRAKRYRDGALCTTGDDDDPDHTASSERDRQCIFDQGSCCRCRAHCTDDTGKRSYRRSDTADTAHIQHAGIHLLPDHHRKKEAKRS